MFFLGKVPSVTSEQLQKQRNKDSLIIDIRQPEAFQKGHVPGAKNRNVQQVLQQPFKQEQTVYIVCYSGITSQRVVKNLNQQGINAYSLKGGMQAWMGELKGGKA